MKRNEKNILIGLLVLVLLTGISIGILFYTTRIVPETNAYQAQMQTSATARQNERNLERLETQRAMTPDG